MRKLISLLGATAVALSLAAAPSMAEAHKRHYRHYHHATRYQETRAERCEGARKRSGNTGTVVGALGGALVGNSLSSGNRTGGTLLGAGVGALAGHQIGKKNSDCR